MSFNPFDTYEFQSTPAKKEPMEWKVQRSKDLRRSKKVEKEKLYQQKRDAKKERKAEEQVSKLALDDKKFVPLNAFKRGEKEDFEHFVREAGKIGLKVSLEEPWNPATECDKRKLFDVVGNIIFQLYKKNKKQGAHLGIVMGNDTSVKVLDVNAKLKMILFSITEPQREVVYNFNEEQLKYLNDIDSYRRFYFGKKLHYATMTRNYVALSNAGQSNELYVWKTQASSVFGFLQKELRSVSSHNQCNLPKEIETSESILVNPICIEDRRMNFIWWKPTTGESFGRSTRYASMSVDVNSEPTRWEVSAFSKKNSNFAIIPDSWKAYLDKIDKSRWLGGFNISSLPSTKASFVRGKIDHFTFVDWHELIHFQMWLPAKIRDTSMHWNF